MSGVDDSVINGYYVSLFQYCSDGIQKRRVQRSQRRETSSSKGMNDFMSPIYLMFQ